MVLTPGNLIEGFAVKPVVRLVPLRWVSEIVPKTKAYFSNILTHGNTSSKSPCALAKESTVQSLMLSPGSRRNGSDRHQATVNGQVNASDITAFFRSQEQRSRSDLLRESQSVQWNARLELLPQRVGGFFG